MPTNRYLIVFEGTRRYGMARRIFVVSCVITYKKCKKPLHWLYKSQGSPVCNEIIYYTVMIMYYNLFS